MEAKTVTLTLTEEDYNRWKAWTEEQQTQQTQRGSWWLTPEGRAKIERVWGPDSYNDGNCVRPLYEALTKVEASQKHLRGSVQGMMEEMARKDEKISRLELEIERGDPLALPKLTHPDLTLHIDRQAFKLMTAIVFGHLRQLIAWDGENSWDEYITERWREARDQALVGWNLLTDGKEPQ